MPPEAAPANASPAAPPEQPPIPVAVPFAHLHLKVLRRPVEFAQYTSSVFDEYCTENNIRRSLGRTGICYDNAVSESFFATYKKELIHTRPWPTLANLEKETSDWIGNYYNPARRHSTLGYLTPGEYELGYRQLSQLAA